MTPQLTSVLVVEDECIIARDLQQTLEELGYGVTGVASSAEEAFDCYARHSADLVLMDIRIPGALDGIAAADLMKKKFALPVVFVTAHADDATLDRAKRVEPDGYLVKPINPAELRSVIETTIYKHRNNKRDRWLSTALSSMADAVVAVDLEGNVTFMNAAAEEVTGVSATAAEGRPARETLQLVGAHEAPLEQALRDGLRVPPREQELLRQLDRSVRVIADSAAPVMEGQEQLGAVMVFRDVTEDRELRRKHEIADRLASLGALAAGVAHEINNPLMIIVGSAELAARELRNLRAPRGAPVQGDSRGSLLERWMGDIQAGAWRAARVVSELSSFVRPKPSPVADADIAHCVEWALSITRHEFTLRASVVTELDVTPRIAMDEAQLGQVLVNLLLNAAHAIRPGSADQQRVTLQTRDAGAGQVCIEIRDTGVGMSQSVLEHLFEPFFTTQAAGAGSGLGLAISHSMVTAAGGRIEVESVLGSGSTFRVFLPAAH